jgi:hypothetical protein
MAIMDEIRSCAAEYEMSTGVKPTRVYLGRSEMLSLGRWAYDAGYRTEPTTAAGEGGARPEVFGLMAYEVNDDEPHIRCCA